MNKTKINSLYIHFPFCKHLCNYCDFYKKKITPGEDDFSTFEAYLRESWPVQQKLFDENNFEFGELDTLYIGGGTPSYWGERGIKFLGSFLKEKGLCFGEDYEFSLEIDPAATTKDELIKWRDLGVNRFSVGLQVFDDELLKIMDRLHTLDQAKALLSNLYEMDVNFTVDFMLGLPKSVEYKRDIKKELSDILEYRPNHISLYLLSVGSSYAHLNNIPKDDYTAEEYILVDKFLTSKGMDHYEVSNYAFDGYRSKHNQKYWNNESVAALGASGTGLLKTNSERAIRYKWLPNKIDYIQENLSQRELNLEKLYTKLRMSDAFEPHEFFPENQISNYKKLENDWIQRGLFDDKRRSLNAYGRVQLDSLIQEIFNKVQF